jgi:hypothetical protein
LDLNLDLTLKDKFTRLYLWPSKVELHGRVQQNISEKAEFLKQDKPEASARRATILWRNAWMQETLGRQQVVWGETFGLPVTDLINNRDYREHPLSDASEINASQWMANTQLFYENFNAQLIVVPVPEYLLLPRRYNNLDIKSEWSAKSDVGPEYGLQLGYLLPFGLDVKAFYLRHPNRIPAFIIDPLTQDIKPIRMDVDSLGGSYSYAFGDLVLRSDFVHHDNHPFNRPNRLEPGRVKQNRFVQGADYSTRFDVTIGAQFHADSGIYLDPETGEFPTIYSGSTQLVYAANGLFNARMFYYSALDGKDSWGSGSLGLRPFEGLQASARVDQVKGKKILTMMGETTRYVGELTFQF